MRSATAQVEYAFHGGMLFKTSEVDGPHALMKKVGNRTEKMTAERQNRDMAGLLAGGGRPVLRLPFFYRKEEDVCIRRHFEK